MEQIVFAQQIHSVWIEPRTLGDYEYKQRTNWNARNPQQRERANLLFSRVEQSIYNIANDIDTGSIAPTGVGCEYVCSISDNIGRIIFEMVADDNDSIHIIIKDFVWDYKTIKDSWWSIVENNCKIDRIITETLNRFILENTFIKNKNCI